MRILLILLSEDGILLPNIFSIRNLANQCHLTIFSFSEMNGFVERGGLAHLRLPNMFKNRLKADCRHFLACCAPLSTSRRLHYHDRRYFVGLNPANLCIVFFGFHIFQRLHRRFDYNHIGNKIILV